MYKVLIRPLVLKDADASWEWRNDEDIWKYTGSKPNTYITKKIEREWIAKAINERDSKRFAILVDDLYVGNIQLTNISYKKAQYHIFIGEKDFWSKGVAQRATYQILYFAKEVLKLKSIYLYVNKSHKSAIKVYKKQDFQYNDLDGEEVKMVCNLNNIKSPKVSIFCMVYNHANYLRDCLDGLLMQKTNFSYEIVVGEDFSSDKSRDILLNYRNRYPGIFKLLLYDKNIGAYENQREILNNCSGKYIAMCEGDDYWTDPFKLQKQVDFLEENEEYSICCHRYSIVNTKTGEVKPDYAYKSFDGDIDKIEIGLYNFFDTWLTKTMTVVFRKDKLNIPDFLKYEHARDVHLFYHLLKKGKGVCLNKNWAVYTINDSGIHSNLDTPQKSVKEYFILHELVNKNPDDIYAIKKLDTVKKNIKRSCAFFLFQKGRPYINKSSLGSYKEYLRHKSSNYHIRLIMFYLHAIYLLPQKFMSKIKL